jgi:hypothetical protein
MKYLFTIIGIFILLSLKAQHEGIRRYFNEYEMNVYPYFSYEYTNDTNLVGFQRFYPLNSALNFSPGNIGSPAVPMVYSLRQKHLDFVFFDNYMPYLKTHEKTRFFDAKKPLTIIRFNGGAKDMDDVHLLHTQNINASLNFGADYNICNSTGHYAEQTTKTTAFNLFASYTNHRYQAHTDFILNKINHFNNGGVQTDSLFELGNLRPENIPVTLYNSSTSLAQIGVQYRHSINLGKAQFDTIIDKKDTLTLKKFTGRASIDQMISFDRFYRIYNDIPSSYYNNIFIDSTQTYDSLALRLLKHELIFKYRLGSDSSFMPSYAAISTKSDLDWYHQYNADNLHINHGIKLSYQQYTSKALINAQATTYFMGYKSGNINMSAGIVSGAEPTKNHLISCILNYDNSAPDFWENHYYSNHFIWDHDFSKIATTSLNTIYSYKPWHVSIGAQLYILKNYIVYNESAMPEQIADQNQIVNVNISKQFNWKSIHWNNIFYFQSITHPDKIPLPRYSGLSNIYFEKYLFKNALLLQIGIDVWYHSQVNGYAYMPANGCYYLQSERSTGNYFMADAYASIKVKRFRAFARMGHFNDAFMPSNYFNMLHYPDRPMAFNFGISWEFYD